MAKERRRRWETEGYPTSAERAVDASHPSRRGRWEAWDEGQAHLLPSAWPTQSEVEAFFRRQRTQHLVAYRPQRTHCVAPTLLAGSAEHRARMAAQAAAHAQARAEQAARDARALAAERWRAEQRRAAAQAQARAETARVAAAQRATEDAYAKQQRAAEDAYAARVQAEQRAREAQRAAERARVTAAERAAWRPILQAARARLEAVERLRRQVKIRLEDDYARQGFVVCAYLARGEHCQCAWQPWTQKTLPFQDVETVGLHRQQEVRDIRERRAAGFFGWKG